MNLFDNFWEDWKKERYKLYPKSRTTARIILTVLIIVLIIVVVRVAIKLS